MLSIFSRWWVAGLTLYHNNKNWLIPFLVWLAVFLRLLTFYNSITIVTKLVHLVWNNTMVVVVNRILEKWRTPQGAAGTIVVMLVGAFTSPESEDSTRENRAVSLFGLAVLISGLGRHPRTTRQSDGTP